MNEQERAAYELLLRHREPITRWRVSDSELILIEDAIKAVVEASHGAELTAALADKARLDWLESEAEYNRRTLLVECFVPSSDSVWWTVKDGADLSESIGEGHLREALDKAIGTAVSGEEEPNG